MKRILSIVAFAAMTTGVFAQDIPLKDPQAKIGMDLFDLIKARAAERNFVKRDVPVADLSTILWAGNGLKGADAVSGASKAGRTIPYSGDNVYMNVYVLTAKGAYLYDPERKVLKQVSRGDSRAQITPEFIPTSSLMLLFTYDFAKAPSFLKSTPALFREMANGTAGYAAENIALAAAAFKLGSIVMYNIKPPAAVTAAKLGKDESPLFIMQVGYLQ
ncbi:MAG: nitroreductase family protein [Spirochaetia bacterium]